MESCTKTRKNHQLEIFLKLKVVKRMNEYKFGKSMKSNAKKKTKEMQDPYETEISKIMQGIVLKRRMKQKREVENGWRKE